jgi:hypothetical protein
VSEAFSGPFYSHTSGYAPAELNYAADCVNAHLDNSGPFDGAIGFSQGAAQLLAYLYQEQIEHAGSSPHSPSLGFWICFSSTAPISRDFECHASLLRGLFPSAVLHGALSPDQSILVETITRSFQSAKLIGVLPKDADVDYFGLEGTENGGDSKTLALDRMPRAMHPGLMPGRLGIPTVHITGKKDLPCMLEMSELAKETCDPATSRAVQHSGGHAIPRSAKEVQKIMNAMEWAMSHSQRSRIRL